LTTDKYKILKTQFGYENFRPGQEAAIDAILSGRDTLAVMSTGAGKSLCYQIPALLLPGMTIVISPLISLMKDQVNALQGAGGTAAFLNSSLSSFEYVQTLEEIRNGKIKLLYIAPERLHRIDFLDETPLVVIDEAHCVSQWGHDFRTSYFEIAKFISRIKPRPVTAAFTATATPKVKEDIQRLLGLKSPVSIDTGFDRPNLFFKVHKPENKKTALHNYLEKWKNTSGIVYCATRKAVDELYDYLPRYGFSVTRYHAGLEDHERRRNQDDFIYDRKTVMIATNAFGMGIDKSNVSYVIHYNMPKNIESYYQEAGRAGRDGAPADCILLYSAQDVRINEYLINQSDEDFDPDPELQEHYRELLKLMTFYSTGNDCLRHRLLSYFGEQASKFCGNCSNCQNEYEETDITVEAQKIISCVYRLKQRSRSFGKTMIIDILRGSKNEKIKSYNLDSLSVWGIMSEKKSHRVRTILDFLIDEGTLSIEGDEFPVVVLGDGYHKILNEEQQIHMKLPKEQEIKFKEDKSQQKKLSKAEIKKADLSEGFDKALFEKLKELRKELAVKEAIPAYIVFSDASLRDMCRKKPVSLVQFSTINGVGNVKLEKYGEVFLEVIKNY
jgi:ATP-dependent DNA helicase RecQ